MQYPCIIEFALQIAGGGFIILYPKHTKALGVGGTIAIPNLINIFG